MSVIKKFYIPDPNPQPIKLVFPCVPDRGVVLYELDKVGEERRFAILVRTSNYEYGFVYLYCGSSPLEKLKFKTRDAEESIRKAMIAGRDVYWLEALVDIAKI